MKVQAFELGDVMIHDVPAGGLGESPTLTSSPTTLDDELRTYFQRKIIDSLSSRGIDVVASEDDDATMRQVVQAVLSDAGKLAEQSGRIATRLSEVQTGANPAGLFVVATGTIDGAAVLALLKLEREEGVRFKVNTGTTGTTVDLQLLRDLTLTKKTRVFKTALLTMNDLSVDLSLAGVASDNQRGQADGSGVANFFLQKVLGCRVAQNPAQATHHFARTTQDWINEADLAAERRGRYQVALLAELQDAKMDIKPKAWSSAALEESDRHSYLEALKGADIDPTRGFQKDVSMTRMSGFKLTFQSGMVLVGKQDDLAERVSIGEERSHIEDAVKTITGR